MAVDRDALVEVAQVLLEGVDLHRSISVHFHMRRTYGLKQAPNLVATFARYHCLAFVCDRRAL